MPNPEENEEKDSLFTRMKYAAFDGFDEVRTLLSEFPQALEAKDSCGETALHWWAIENHLDAVKLLIGRGAQVDTKSDIIGPTPLMCASSLGLANMVQLLIDSGADVGAIDVHGDTPMHYAASSNRPEMIKQLLRNGGDPAAKNLMEETPLDVAAVMNASDAMAMLTRFDGRKDQKT